MAPILPSGSQSPSMAGEAVEALRQKGFSFLGGIPVMPADLGMNWSTINLELTPNRGLSARDVDIDSLTAKAQARIAVRVASCKHSTLAMRKNVVGARAELGPYGGASHPTRYLLARRDVRAAAEETTTPPDELTPSQHIARVVKAEGKDLYTCLLPNKQTVLVELAARFRSTIWIIRGGYVLVDLMPADEKKGKVEGEIMNVVREQKQWRKQSYWPKEFAKATYNDEEDEEPTIGKMPPSYSEDEE
ncbi:hypothetical protein NUW58_g381 [Xylaria curta]|uniref:Uncharacterized protein n=1 Tax=Xylaria curta TaxID=42375 RepID=A0ACC1PQK4_9PEZI|nr:hypothetical protein NUW58_g381 [Xylaria curta]